MATILLGAESALASSHGENSSTAEALFQSATELVAAGDYAAGCPKFEASFALYASASTMLNIARCHEHEGKWATALEDYKRALVLNRETHGEKRRKSLEAIAMQGIASIEPRVPKLRIVIAQQPTGLKVFRNGQGLPLATIGEALPANPGQVKIRASAPGYRTEELTIVAKEGETAIAEIVLTPLPPSTPTWVWITGGAGILLAGTAAAFAIDNSFAVQALRNNCRDIGGRTYCAAGYDYQSDNARKNRDLGLSVGLGSAATIAIGAATVGLVHARASNREERARMHATVRPWFNFSTVGAIISGDF